MVANPNSNLVFDFPDPTPRFEFDKNSSPTRSNTPTNKKNKIGGGGIGSGGSSKRFGKFSKLGWRRRPNTNEVVESSSNSNTTNSPSKESSDGGGDVDTTTTATTSLNSSLNSSNSPISTTTRTPSPSGSRGSGGGIHYGLAESPSSSSSTKLNLLPSVGSAAYNNKNGLHKRTGSKSGASIASGFISEVSEFSFDRVTVMSNDMTGQSSNVSWNFLDDALLATVGMQDNNAKNGTGIGCTPYTGGGGSLVKGEGAAGGEGGALGGGPSQATAALTKNNNGQKIKGKLAIHQKSRSTSTFDNVSLDTEDELDNIPYTGKVSNINKNQHSSSSDNQSVISELSDRTGGNNNTENGNSPEERVKALLREGMASATKKGEGSKAGDITAGGGNQGQPPSNGEDVLPLRTKPQTVASSLTSNKTATPGLLSWYDIQTTYTEFKTSRNKGKPEKSSILSSIVEDVQFCGLYFCGIDTTTDGDDDIIATGAGGACGAMMNNNDKYENEMKLKKEDRKRQTDENFLGKIINCVPSGCGY